MGSRMLSMICLRSSTGLSMLKNNMNGLRTARNLVGKRVNLSNKESFFLLQPRGLCRFCTEAKLEAQNRTLVYEGPLRKRIKVVKLLSLTSSLAGFSLLPKVFLDVSAASYVLAGGIILVSTAFLSTPFLLHWITKRYVIQLYYDSNKQLFTAKTLNILSQEKELTFSAEDVTVPDFPGFLSSFNVKDIPLFVDASMVVDPDAYSHMMGYDKPLDLRTKSDRNELKES